MIYGILQVVTVIAYGVLAAALVDFIIGEVGK